MAAWRRATAGLLALVAAVGVGYTRWSEPLNLASDNDEVLSAAVGRAPRTLAPLPTIPASGSGSGSGSATTAIVAVPVATAPPKPLATATPTAEPIERYTLAFTGDILSHMPVVDAAARHGSELAAGLEWDYRPMFAEVRAHLAAADAAICVLETPLSADNTDLTGYPSFNAPGDLADALAQAGYDVCATASNHSLDRGTAGIRSTLGELDRVEVRHAGMARSDAESRQITLMRTGDLDVAFLSWTYGLNGYRRPDGELWWVDVTDAALVIDEAERARTDGADVVVLNIQWGAEYQVQPTEEQQSLARVFADSGAIDLIVGNHAHVVQPLARVGSVPVVYGLGNFLSNQPAPGYPARTQDGVIIEVSVEGSDATGWRIPSISAIPTWVDKRDRFVIRPVVETLSRDDLDVSLRAELEASLVRTTEALRLLGEDPVID